MNKKLIEEEVVREEIYAASIVSGTSEMNAGSVEPTFGNKQRVQEVARQLHEDIGRGRKRAVNYAILLGTFTVATAGSVTANVSGWLGWFIALMFLLLTICIISCAIPTRRRTRNLQVLANEAGVAEVGTLLEMCNEVQAARTEKGLRRALIRHLPSLREGDAIRLSRRNRTQLHEALEVDRFGPYKSERADYVIAVLKAMEQIGDERSLSLVRRLVTSYSRATGERKRVCEAAIECLPILESRLMRSKSPSVLLRPSAIGPNQELLRSVETGISDTQALLLRPGDGG